jgi:hypothetical protein
MIARRIYPLLWAAFTLILAGYFMVWLPQPVVGLSFIGLEMGEWVKFLPAVQAGEMPDRNFFYLPPFLLALMMIVWTAGWPNGRWQTWAMRGLAFVVSLLVFPALEAIRFEPASEWLLRLGWIGLVGVSAVLAGSLGRLGQRGPVVILLLLALIGLVLPTWAYVEMRPVIAELFRTDVGVGPGLVLHIGGNLLVMVAAVLLLRRPDWLTADSSS